MKKDAYHFGRPPAIVIGLDCITGLQAARVLADRQVPVVGLASNRSHYCCATRACREQLIVDISSEALIGCLEQLGPRLNHHAVLFPCTDLSVLQLSRHRERLRFWYHVMLPEADTVEMLMDKVRFLQFAKDHRLPIPNSFVLASESDAKYAAQHTRYPCVLKPPVKTLQWQQKTRSKGFVVENPSQLLSLYERCRDWSDVLLLQEWIAGPTSDQFTCDSYFGAGSEPLVTFTSRKLRQWPLETGVGSLGEEYRSEVVRDEMVRFYQCAGHRGLGYLEMKRDVRSGVHYIIEPNVGRPTGRSAAADAGGVELLYTMYCDALGLPLPTARQQKYTRRKWIHWRRDLQAAGLQWHRGELSLAAWSSSLRGPKTCAVFRWSDPKPFLADLVRTARRVLSALLASCFRRTTNRATEEAPPPKAEDSQRSNPPPVPRGERAG